MTREEIQHAGYLAIANKQRSGLIIAQRVGKTRVGIKDMLRQFTPVSRFLVVAPLTKIYQSWIDECEEMNVSFLLDHIEFSTYRSLPKTGLDFDTKYLDECHSLLPSHNAHLKLYIESGGRTVGLTGTYPPGKKSDKAKMCLYYCPPVINYPTDQAVEDGILNDYRITVHKLKLTKKKVVEKRGQHGVWMNSEENEYIYWTDKLETKSDPKELERLRIKRMSSMQGFPTKIKYAQLLMEEQTDKTLLFAETKAQANELCSHSVYSGKADALDNLYAFQAGDITKLSAVRQLSMGLTIPNLKVIIILHSYANNRNTAQRLARAMSLNPDEVCDIHILCYEDTVDKWWVTNALKQYNQDKIKWVPGKFYQGTHYKF